MASLHHTLSKMESRTLPEFISEDRGSPLNSECPSLQSESKGCVLVKDAEKNASLSRNRGSGRVLKYGVEVSAQTRSSSVNEKVRTVFNTIPLLCKCLSQGGLAEFLPRDLFQTIWNIFVP